MVGGPGKLHAYGALGIVLAGVAAWGLVMLAFTTDDPRTITREVPAPLVTTAATVADVARLFKDAPAQTVAGTDLGLPGGTCDVRYQTDGVVIVCHQ